MYVNAYICEVLIIIRINIGIKFAKICQISLKQVSFGKFQFTI